MSPALLYHATACTKLPSILVEGLRARSYWSDDDTVADYYKGTVEDDDEVPVLLVVTLSDLDPDAMAPDQPGVDEPITRALGLSEDEVYERWSRSDRTWQESLEIVHSVCYERCIASEHLRVVVGDDAMPLTDYLRTQRAPSAVICSNR